MFLPPGLTVTLFRLLQLTLSLLYSDQPTLHSVISNEDRQEGSNNLGSLSPSHHDAPAVPGVSADLPDDCAADQVILLYRHGSRGPVKEQAYILKLDDALDKARDVIQAADLPQYLEFLEEGCEYQCRHGLDLSLDGYSGRVSRRDPGPLLGAFYIKKPIGRLTDTTEDAKSLYLDFAHQYGIFFPLSTIVSSKNAVPLNRDRLPTRRKFQSSYQTCSLDALVRNNENSAGVEYEREIWNATCELGGSLAPS